MPSRDGDRAAEQEAAGVDAGDEVGAARDVGDRVGDRGQSGGVGQHRRQVLEQHAGFREVGHLTQQGGDDVADVVRVAHWLSFHRSMFHPAPQRVGLPLTAYIFVDASRVRC